MKKEGQSFWEAEIKIKSNNILYHRAKVPCVPWSHDLDRFGIRAKK